MFISVEIILIQSMKIFIKNSNRSQLKNNYLLKKKSLTLKIYPIKLITKILESIFEGMESFSLIKINTIIKP